MTQRSARRRAAALVAGVLLAVALAGCAGGSGEPGGDASGSQDAVAAPDGRRDGTAADEAGPADVPRPPDGDRDVTGRPDGGGAADADGGGGAPDAGPARDVTPGPDADGVSLPDALVPRDSAADTAPDGADPPPDAADPPSDTARPPDVPAPPDVPPPPPPCEGPHPCAREWGLPPGLVSTSCTPSGTVERCTYALVDGAEPLVTLQAIYSAAIAHRRRVYRLTAAAEPAGCVLPPPQALTPAPLDCCRDGAPQPVCAGVGAAWNTPTWAALGVSFADGDDHAYAYAFDHEPDRLIVRAERPARCGEGLTCRHRFTVVGLLDGGCGAMAPFEVEHSVVGTCPPEAGRRLGAIDLTDEQAAAFRPPSGVLSVNPDYAEADAALSAIVTAAAAFYAAQPAGACRFPADTGPTPAAATCCGALGGPDADGDGRCDGTPPGFATGGWPDVGFAPVAPAFVYELGTRPAAGGEGDPLFEASAYGDLDCDGLQSTFRRFVRPDPAAGTCTAAPVRGHYVDSENE